MEELHEEGVVFLKTLFVSTTTGMEEDLRGEEYKFPKEVDAKSWGDYPGEMATLVEASEKDRGRVIKTRRPEDKAREENKPQEKNREDEASKIKHYGMEGMEAPKQQRGKGPEVQMPGKRGRQGEERQRSRSPKRHERGERQEKGGPRREERQERGVHRQEERPSGGNTWREEREAQVAREDAIRQARIDEARGKRDAAAKEERRRREKPREEVRAAEPAATSAEMQPAGGEELLPEKEVFRSTSKEPSMGSEF